jgi:hypothetical protein
VRRQSENSFGDPVFTWAFASSQPRGGQIIQYETRLEENGTIRCNCPGWIFSKGEPADKTCKHKKLIGDEAPDILRRFRRGEELPTMDLPPGLMTRATGRASSADTGPAGPVRAEVENTKARYGRVIEI